MKAVMLCRIVLAASLAESCSARAPAPPPPLEVHTGEFISARRCGDCHTELSSVDVVSTRNFADESDVSGVAEGSSEPCSFSTSSPVTHL